MKNNWLRTTIREFESYQIPVIKESTVINANESPYNILEDFPAVKEDFLKNLASMPVYHYPDGYASKLRAALADYVGRPTDNVLVGNGGDEIISLISNTFLNPGDTILIHTPTFDIYAIDAEVLGAKVVAVPDLPGYERDQKTFLGKVKELQPKITYLCNPNNPTGEILPLSYVEEVIEAAENIVVIDEAYLEFANQDSIITKLDQYDNVIVIRTLSKAFGLAGARLGYGVAQKELIDALSLTKLVYNMNVLTQSLGLAAMAHGDEVLTHNIPPTIAAREYLVKELAKLPGITPYRSVTNFVLVHVPDAKAMVQALCDADICVRFYKAKDLENCVRITVTTQDVMERVVAVFQKEVSRHA